MKIRAKALTFEDVLLIPAYSEVLPKEVSLKTYLSKNITLNIPFVSAAMDTVTEYRTAIAMARLGGIGIVHKNMDIPSQLVEGLRSSMGYLGSLDIPTLWERAEFVKITSAGLRESHVHDVVITKEAPNYHG